MITLDNETIRLITLFENVTGAPVKDCVLDESSNTIYYIVEQGKAGMAIGKEGTNIKNAERIIGKDIKIFEFSNDVNEFVRKLIPQAVEIKIKSDSDKSTVEVKVERRVKAVVIGREGRNIKILKELLQRNSEVDLVVR